MNKKVKWGIIIFIGAGLIGWRDEASGSSGNNFQEAHGYRKGAAERR